MKLKNWASVGLILIAIGCVILTFIDNTKINIAVLIILAACASIYGKYSKFVDWR